MSFSITHEQGLKATKIDETIGCSCCIRTKNGFLKYGAMEEDTLTLLLLRVFDLTYASF